MQLFRAKIGGGGGGHKKIKINKFEIFNKKKFC